MPPVSGNDSIEIQIDFVCDADRHLLEPAAGWEHLKAAVGVRRGVVLGSLGVSKVSALLGESPQLVLGRHPHRLSVSQNLGTSKRRERDHDAATRANCDTARRRMRPIITLRWRQRSKRSLGPLRFHRTAKREEPLFSVVALPHNGRAKTQNAEEVCGCSGQQAWISRDNCWRICRVLSIKRSCHLPPATNGSCQGPTMVQSLPARRWSSDWRHRDGCHRVTACPCPNAAQTVILSSDFCVHIRAVAFSGIARVVDQPRWWETKLTKTAVFQNRSGQPTILVKQQGRRQQPRARGIRGSATDKDWGSGDANLAVSSLRKRVGRVEGEVHTGPLNLDWAEPGEKYTKARAPFGTGHALARGCTRLSIGEWSTDRNMQDSDEPGLPSGSAPYWHLVRLPSLWVKDSRIPGLRRLPCRTLPSWKLDNNAQNVLEMRAPPFGTVNKQYMPAQYYLPFNPFDFRRIRSGEGVVVPPEGLNSDEPWDGTVRDDFSLGRPSRLIATRAAKREQRQHIRVASPRERRRMDSSTGANPKMWARLVWHICSSIFKYSDVINSHLYLCMPSELFIGPRY